MSYDLKVAIEAAKKAGEIIKEAYKKDKEVKDKGGSNNFVTETDSQAEKIIIEYLKQSGYSILGEESGLIENQSKKKWIIDPIDGTTNFIRGIPFFAVSIALLENSKNLVLGVVYDPIADECYWAERDKGAFLNGEKISISELSDFNGSIILIEHGRSEKNKEDFSEAWRKLTLNNGAPNILRQGSTALMLCYTARGSCEAFLSCGDELYDYAGGLIIVKEAGAVISDWHGKDWDNSSSYILVSNSKIQGKIIDRLSGIQ